MSRGAGVIQRTILHAIAEPDALPTHPGTRSSPVGVTVQEIHHRLGHYSPTRSQRHSVQRAIRVLAARRLLDAYSHRTCGRRTVADDGQPCACGVNYHPFAPVVGRVRNADEDLAWAEDMKAARALMARALAG